MPDLVTDEGASGAAGGRGAGLSKAGVGAFTARAAVTLVVGIGRVVTRVTGL